MTVQSRFVLPVFNGCSFVAYLKSAFAFLVKNRLGKVDGRYPHWVSNYNVDEEERFSLIYYDTLSSYQTPGPAIFSIPHDKKVCLGDMEPSEEVEA
jgi:hypothetical protein